MIREVSFAQFSKLTAVIAGSLVAALGLMVLGGWYTHTMALVQFAPTLVPMQLNAALSFILSGVGLLALTRGWSRLAATCGAVVGLIGLGTLIEYLCGVNLGIDQLFMRPYITTYTSHPGRMAPNTALCLTLAGITLLVMSRSVRLGHVFLTAGPLAAIILSLGLVASIGYITGLQTYSWGYFTDMAVYSALGCTVLGGGIITFAWWQGAGEQATASQRFAVLVGIGVLTITLCLWQALIASNNALIRRTITIAEVSVQNTIMTQMQSRIFSLMRMAKRWEMQGRPAKDVWEADAQLYATQFPGLQAIAWIDPTFHVRWVAPHEDNESRQGLDLSREESQRSALELARNSRQVTAAQTLSRGQRGEEFQVFVPIAQDARFDGFIAGVFNLRDLFDVLLSSTALRYSIAVYEGNKEIYGRYDFGRKHERRWGQEATVGLYGVTWRVRLWPSPALLAEELSPLPEVVLSVGLLTGALLMLAVYLAHLVRWRAMQVDAINQALHHEISEHTRTEVSLAARIRQMEAVRAISMEVTRELDLASLLSLLTRRAADLVEAAGSGAVYLWDAATDVLIPHAWHGHGAWLPGSHIHLGEGIVGTVAQRQVGLIVNDYQHSPYMPSHVVEDVSATAMIAEPLLYRDRLVGVIVLDNRGTTQPFTNEDRELVTLFAAQAAIAIDNARLYETLESRLNRLQTLTRLNQLVSSSLDTGKVLSAIARAAATLMDATMVSFWLVDASTQTLEVHGFSDSSLATDFPVSRLSFGQGGEGWVAMHRRPLNVPDVFADDRFVLLDWRQAHNLRSFLGVPIIHEETLIAVLSLNGQQPFHLEAEDRSLLDNFVAQAAAAIRNAGLFANVQERTAHLAQLNAELQSEIAERQRAEEALRASEARFRSLVQSANDAIVLADNQGRIIAWNQGAHSTFGYTEAEVLGQPLTVLMPSRYHEAHQRGIARLQTTGQPRLIGKTIEFHGRHKDGHEVPLEISLAVWQVGGNTFCSGIMRDLTERRQAAEQLQRQQEALYQREKLAAMGSLLASVAHELNNPLSVVMMQADLLSAELTDDALVDRVSAISQSAERCVYTVRNFLALARQNPPQRTSVMLKTVVQEALALLAYTLRVDDIKVQQELADDQPPLWGDPHQLYQVVVNLLTNAHQALRESPPPRRLRLTTQYDPDRRLASLEVADTGPGIAPELQTRIFEPFFTTKPQGVGTGLGLPFCKGIIEAHGGSIEVTSQPGQGTVFRIELPVEAVPSAVPVAPAATAPPTVDGRAILVIDDEPGITSALAYLLRRDGHTVETAANGRIALGKLQAQSYNLILCDLRMPELDGPGLYRELMQRYPHLLQRIIFLTGDTLSTESRTFLESAGVTRLSKPFRAAEVRAVVQQALQD